MVKEKSPNQSQEQPDDYEVIKAWAVAELSNYATPKFQESINRLGDQVDRMTVFFFEMLIQGITKAESQQDNQPKKE
ncbi:hypothetical protein ACFL0Y_04255 [Patescibacteria group bacterium]